VGRDPHERAVRPQGRTLLAFLALNRARPVGRDDLIHAVWGEEAPPARRADLSSLLSRARRLLGDAAIVGKGRASLQLGDHVNVDFHDARRSLLEAESALRDSATDAARDAAQRAVTIADRGVLVGETHDWLDAWRRELAELGVRARVCVVEAALLQGAAELPTAVRCARELVAAEPYCESSHALLMRALGEQGNVAQALRVYDDMRARLREELGLAPGPKLRELHGRLLNQPVLPAAAGTVRAPVALPHCDGDLVVNEPAPPTTVAVRSPVSLPHGDEDFVGRMGDLRRLSAALDEAAAGGCRMMLVEGEAGIGKTRLVLQFARECRARGVLALYGRADAEAVMPYQPLAEALSGHLAEAPAHLPALARLLGADGNGATERYGIVEACCAVLHELSRSQPLMLVLDDLHWADEPTLLMVGRIVRCTSTAPVLIVLSYRACERGELLARTLADLRREHELPRIALGGLDRHDAAKLVGRLDHSRGGDARRLWERSRGNPFFLKELVRHGDTSVPDAIADVIRERLARLSPPLRAVLEIACVAGSVVSIELLELLRYPGPRAPRRAGRSSRERVRPAALRPARGRARASSGPGRAR
jgi:pentatricopeptide repeat protein